MARKLKIRRSSRTVLGTVPDAVQAAKDARGDVNNSAGTVLAIVLQ
jgi:hypothetical protein